MFDLSAFSAQVVVDQQILKKLRHQSLQSSDVQVNGPAYSFSELLDAQIGYHLRGLDLGAKEEVKHAALNKMLENPSDIRLSQKDLAEMILELPFPLERRIKNLQNWVTLSTDFTLNFEEVSIMTRAYDIEAEAHPIEDDTHRIDDDTLEIETNSLDHQEEAQDAPRSIHTAVHKIEVPTFVETIVSDSETNDSEAIESEAIDFNFNEKKGNRYEDYVKNYDASEVSSELEELSSNPEVFVWEDAPEAPQWLQNLQGWLEHQVLWKQMLVYKKLLTTTGKLVALMCLTAVAVFVIGKFFMPVSEPFIFTDACHLVKQASQKPAALEIASKAAFDQITPGMPTTFEYSSVNIQRLKGYLKRKNSLLANEPYFTEILKKAAQNNVNPALLFAITGQEQGFVRSDDPDSEMIANNPFNVYHSWKEYNTNIQDSAEIASQTIVEISSKKPKNTNSFKWLNQRYAEDTNWWIGVEYFYYDISNYMAQ